MKTWIRTNPEKCQCPTCKKKAIMIISKHEDYLHITCGFCEMDQLMTPSSGRWKGVQKYWTERYNCQTRRLEPDE